MAKVPSPKNFRQGEPPPSPKKVRNLNNPEPTALTPLNFKVPEEFHREFKTYAAKHGVTMLDLLQEGFRLLKEHRGE